MRRTKIIVKAIQHEPYCRECTIKKGVDPDRYGLKDFNGKQLKFPEKQRVDISKIIKSASNVDVEKNRKRFIINGIVFKEG